MHITVPSDSGAIEVVDASDPRDLRLAIPADSNCDFRRWFHFRMAGVRDRDCRITFVNAGACSYLGGWEDYRVVASHDGEDRFRIPARYDGTVLSLEFRSPFDALTMAYFAPYPRERHRAFAARCQVSPRARLEVVGRSVDGDHIDMLTIGEPAPGRRICWLIARQHPGEAQGAWWMEGLLERLLDTDDALARRVLERAVLHVVPCMNPDGVRRSNLRANAAGINLNAEWEHPSPDTSPEVHAVRARMLETGVDFLLDVHGDEGHPYVYIIRGDRLPNLDKRQLATRATFDAALAAACPDHSTEFEFERRHSKTVQTYLCSSWAAAHFGCLAMTLEMPFKDNIKTPDPHNGWSPAHCRRLGAATLNGLDAVLDDLR